jgi:acyl carrier protein
MSATLERVIPIVAAVLRVPPATLNAQSSPEDVPTWDSMQHLQIILALEEAFAMKFAAHEIDQLQTVRALCDAVERRT